jgi:hypothetical protein
MQSTKSPNLELFSEITKKHSDSTKMFSETDIINMLKFYIDNIFCMFGGRVFHNKQSSYLWVQTVLLFSLTCAFIRMRLPSYRRFSRTSTKHTKYVVNVKLEHVDNISFRKHFCRIRVFFSPQIKICPFLAQGMCIYVGHSF